MGRLIRRFMEHVVPGVVRPLHSLWNQIIGFVFIILALWATPSLIRYVREFNGDADDVFRIGLAVGFTALMMYFGIASFLRARKISRS
jgi:O-antigen/teichoic acid export membrane protein